MQNGVKPTALAELRLKLALKMKALRGFAEQAGPGT
jgi:hypothetical protein